ncbi:hypothetical protein [Nostoc sp. JL33]|nr:hypothetical protein [Nostoc sp. JL33]MBN3871738.1 hypothetical protein [Nostoc sp. JL33]
MNAVVNPFRVECDRTEAKISMQWTSDVYDGLFGVALGLPQASQLFR